MVIPGLLTAAQAQALERCIAAGGVAVVPTDTVYGLCCDAADPDAVAHLDQLKGRAAGKASAVMFSSVSAVLAQVCELGPRTRAALGRLLPGPVTVLVPNVGRLFPLAGGGPLLGVRVPAHSLGVSRPLLQSSANLSGGPDPSRLRDVPGAIRAGADLVLDGGRLPGVSSTVVELGSYETDGVSRILRRGAVAADEIAAMLDGETSRPTEGR